MEGRPSDALAKTVVSHTSRRRIFGALASVAATSLWDMTSRSAPVAAQVATPASSDVAGALTPAAGSPQIRKNAKTLCAAERRAFVNAVLGLKQKPSPWVMGLSVYDTFVLWHRDIFACSLHFAHHRPLFLPWHRMFTHLFEQQLQAIEPTVTIPYWDWTVDNTPDAYLWHDDLLGGNGDTSTNYAVVTGPFAAGKWTITIFDYGADERRSAIVRNFGAASLAPTLPTAADVAAAMSIATYDVAPWNSTVPAGTSFRNALEGYRDCVDETCDPISGITPICTSPPNLHNRVHLWVAGTVLAPGGTPVTMPTAAPDGFGTMWTNGSPNDPVFWLHHSNVDRLWSQWLQLHGPTYEPVAGGPLGQNIDDAMWPFSQIGITATPRSMLDHRALGYVYDTEQ